MTHGHELKGGDMGGRGCAGRTGIEGGNGTTNSMINKIYYIKIKLFVQKGRVIKMYVLIYVKETLKGYTST